MTAEDRRAELIVHAALLVVLGVVVGFAVWWVGWAQPTGPVDPVVPATAAPAVPYTEEP